MTSKQSITLILVVTGVICIGTTLVLGGALGDLIKLIQSFVLLVIQAILVIFAIFLFGRGVLWAMAKFEEWKKAKGYVDEDDD